MSERKVLLPWWLWCICLAGLAAGLSLVRWGGDVTDQVRNGTAMAAERRAPKQPQRLAALPRIADPVVLIHRTVGKLQLFDGKRLVAEYDVTVDDLPPEPVKAAVINRKVSGGEHGPFVLISDAGGQSQRPQVLAVVHAQPLPDDVKLPGVSMKDLQLKQMMDALPVGTPVVILR